MCRPIARLLLSASLGAMGCGDVPSRPDGTTFATLALQPVLPPALAEASFDLAVDRARLRLARLDGERLLDSTITFPADSSQVSLRLKVPLLTRREVLSATLELRAGTRLLFAGNRQVEVGEEAAVAPTIPLQYVGPGSELTSLRLSPRDTVLRPGDSFTFGVEAFSPVGAVPAFYVGWNTSNPTVAAVNARGTLRAPNQRSAVTLRAVSPTGIKDSIQVWFAPPPVRLEMLSGNAQTSQAGLQLAELLGVRAVAGDGQGVPGIRVRFRSLSNGRTLDTLLITDQSGAARTAGVLGPAAGPQFFEAIAPLLPTVTFTASATAGPPSAIAVIGGNGQQGTVARVLSRPLTVLVSDGVGNPTSGVPLTWEITSGGGTLFSASATTNLSGVGFADLQLGRQAGFNTVRVRIPAGASVELLAVGRPDVATALRILEGDGQVAVVGRTLRPFIVEVSDSLGNPVPGASVRWSPVNGHGSLSPTASTTDPLGRAVTVYSLPAVPGTYQVRADLLGTEASVIFEVVATEPSG